MMRPLLWSVLGVLFMFLYTAGPAGAQQRPPGTPASREDEQALRETIRRVDQARRQEAQRWAAARRLPLRSTHRTGGRTVQLIAVDDGRPVYVTSLNLEAARATGTHLLHPGQRLALDLTGRDLPIGIWDAGHVLEGHQELQGRVARGKQVPPAFDDHATHVAGTIAATGLRAEARGMAYEALVRSYDWTNDATEMNSEAAQGLLVSNHSYGMIAGWHFGDIEGEGEQWYWFGDPAVSMEEDYAFGWYSVDAVQFDRVTAANPYYLPVVAAGNDRGDRGPSSGPYRGLDARGSWQTYTVEDRPIPRDGGPHGYDTIAGAATAKNVLTVGSIGPATEGAPHVSTFTSFGPTDDGRIKPDLVGYGEQVFSTLSTGRGMYGTLSGTSMATANVSGSLLLLQQHHYNLTGTAMRAATLKGIVLHTAADLGPPGPDYQYGWGLLDMEAAALQITASLSDPLALLEAELEDEAVFEQHATVEEAGPLRVTLSWTDLPSARRSSRGATTLDSRTPHLRNDLDLLVINEATGETYRPYVLDPERPAAPAVTGDNRVDPVEQVFVAHAEADTYRILVSHKDRLVSEAVQPFSLIVSGASSGQHRVATGHFEAEASPDEVVLRWQTLFEHSQGTFQVERAPITFAADNTRHVGPATPVATLMTHGSADKRSLYEVRDANVLSGLYLYRLLFTDAASQHVAGEIDVHVPSPAQLALLANYPNPFAHHTHVVLDLPTPQHVTVEVYDALGRRVARLHDGSLPAGRHELALDATDWPPGVYVARVRTPQGVQTHRMVVAR